MMFILSENLPAAMVLSVIDPQEPFQTPYQPAIQELVSVLLSALGADLHSAYIYGSVARKTAVLGASNLDVAVVTSGAIRALETSLQNSIRWRFHQRYPFIRGIEFKQGMVDEVASLGSIFSWGFMLHHCAVCVYGKDIGESFGDFEPSWEIAKQ